MTKTIRLTLILSLTLVVLSATLVAAEQPTLTWVYPDDSEPFAWVENGVPKGSEVEIVEKVFSRLGIKVNHKGYPWLRAMKMVELGEADMMMTTPNDGRFSYAIFGKEWTEVNFWTIYVKKGNAELKKKVEGFTRLDDLKQYRLADFAGNGWQTSYMKQEDGYNIAVQTATIQQLPQVLASGRVDMIINSEKSMDWNIEKLGLAGQIEKVNAELPGTRFHFVAMVSRKSPWAQKGIIRAFDEELKKVKQSGEWIQILKKYKDPHGLGKPFKTQINDSKYLADYNNYPVYKP